MLRSEERDFTIDTDKSRLQLDTIHQFLSESYWAKGAPLVRYLPYYRFRRFRRSA